MSSNEEKVFSEENIQTQGNHVLLLDSIQLFFLAVPPLQTIFKLDACMAAIAKWHVG